MSLALTGNLLASFPEDNPDQDSGQAEIERIQADIKGIIDKKLPKNLTKILTPEAVFDINLRFNFERDPHQAVDRRVILDEALVKHGFKFINV